MSSVVALLVDVITSDLEVAITENYIIYGDLDLQATLLLDGTVVIL